MLRGGQKVKDARGLILEVGQGLFAWAWWRLGSPSHQPHQGENGVYQSRCLSLPRPAAPTPTRLVTSKDLTLRHQEAQAGSLLPSTPTVVQPPALREPPAWDRDSSHHSHPPHHASQSRCHRAHVPDHHPPGACAQDLGRRRG